ncbi:MAG: MBL fold metallo-hydrolase [Clostridiales bacterium]|nr:MBL fold metallo-hydrolase [Clostridiales bacterium]
MIIKALVENTASDADYSCEHGLSLYIETEKHKLLFDMGASGLLADNAAKMGVNLGKVDLAVISHGHHDHGGGLRTFLDLNAHAKIYMHSTAFEKHYGKRPAGVMEDIGLDTALLPNRRFVFTGDNLVIDDELMLFSEVMPEKHNPSGNRDLYMADGGKIIHDDFRHEQNLMIDENGKTVLVAGCAHKGIVNIINRLNMLIGRMPDYVIGGFHLYSPSFKKSEDPSVTDAIGEYLLNTGAMFYTCHCTGLESHERLKRTMSDKLAYLSAGQQIAI